MRRLMFVMLLFLLAACGAPDVATQPTAAPIADPDPCSSAVLQPYRAKYNNLMARWFDTVVIAGQAKPEQLSGSIVSLQKLAEELASLQPPACAQDAHGESLDAMKRSIGGYQDLMAKKEIGATLREAIDELSVARSKITALPGEPAPTATAMPTLPPEPTWTPLPTAAPTATPEPTATPLPRNGVIASSRVQVYETATSDNPIKTLLKNTAVLVFETEKSRIHIRAGDVEGWVSKSSVVVQ